LPPCSAAMIGSIWSAAV